VEPILFQLHSELEARHWWFVGRRRILFPLIDTLMKGREGDLIVDVGCGTGGTVGFLSAHHPCLGIDTSPIAIETARRTYPHARFIAGRCPDDLRATADKTGLYLLMDVLEHIEGDRRFLENVVALARPGTHILITVPARKSLWSRHDVTAEHLRRYEIDELRRLFAGLPVSVTLLSFFNARLYPVIRVARFLGNKFGRSVGRDSTDFALHGFGINGLLTRIFAGEGPRIHALHARPGGQGFPRGASLVAVLRKQ
jgi:SAM-dependent methyltransferase